MKLSISRTSWALAVIVSLGLGVRLAYLIHATSQPRYVWDDPDHYALKGRVLAGDGEGWHWTFEVVRHSSYDHRFYTLPPGYPVFLSLFALFPGYPLTAQVAQVFLSAAAVALVFVLGRQIHSERAGLVAAAIYALWLPNIIAVWSTMQESVYIPVALLGLVLFVGSVQQGRSGFHFALAGAVLGLAALTRSMPTYVLPVFAALLIYQKRRQSLWPVAGLFLGFLLLTVPYSIFLSRSLGQTMFIENHGSIFIVERYGGVEGDDPPGLFETAGILAGGFAEAPLGTMEAWWSTLRSVLHVNGGRLLQIYLGASTKAGALAAKLAAHALGDLLFAIALVLAPLGLVLCRRPELASYLFIWIAVHLGLTVLSGFGGSRLRAPFAPHLVALSAVVLAGGYRREISRWLGTAVAASLALAAIILPQFPASLRARADYGVHWPLDPPPKRSAMEARAGFNVLVVDGAVRFRVRPRNPSGRTVVEVRLEGEPVETVTLEGQEHRFELSTSMGGLAYVELTARDAATEAPVPLYVIIPRVI